MTQTKVKFAWAPDELRGLLAYSDGKLYLSCGGCGSSRQTAGKSAILKVWKEDYDKCLDCMPNKNGRSKKFTKEEVASWPNGHKRCVECAEIKLFGDFHKHSGALFGYNTVCKKCRLPKSKEKYSQTTFEQSLFDSAKSRARKKNREFSLTVEDIIIPEICPILNVPIVLERHSDYAPSIDRTDSSKGYTKDNIVVMSRRANILKNNMTKEEALMLYSYLVKL